MKTFTIIFTVLYLGLGFAITQRIDKVTVISLQYVSGMCEGYCTINIKVDQTVKSVTRIPGTANGQPSVLVVKSEICDFDHED
ncbi:hypothetical protein [Kriegella aquimaris]|uniref:Uncharacterized protein n=1 Tax=Kriegella aquimaris TaxID=192904 RepID=A0A1G9WX99_9FLAO|nr:hypothetical protein [Kriegella aquimaris]SDM89122.1 hypothetical protein SAMN04488514_11699 [Kriegella aquimaris]